MDRIMHKNLRTTPWERMSVVEGLKALVGMTVIGWLFTFNSWLYLKIGSFYYPFYVVLGVILLICFLGALWHLMNHGFKLVVYGILLWAAISVFGGKDLANTVIFYPLMIVWRAIGA